MAKPSKRGRRLRLAGLLILIGLIFEAISLYWDAPMSFFLFILVSGTFTLAGILIFLYALISTREPLEDAAEKGPA